MKVNSFNRPNLLHKLAPRNFPQLLLILVIVASLAGIGTGYYLASSETPGQPVTGSIIDKAPDTPQEDNRTFRDFAEGKLTVKPTPKSGQDYSEGTHLLIREGAVPVTLTSSVVDLSLYENKEVKVFGETQKAIQAGWLMDVGKVEVKE